MSRRGFTLVEVVVALSILTVVMLALITLTLRTMHTSIIFDREQAALQLVTDRTDQILFDPRYDVLDSIYVGTENNFPTLDGLSRVTTFRHVVDSINDYKKFTVTVSGSGMANPIARTITVAAP
ncbi:MAG: type II secretion system protein [Gemmatimonadaceae bacterium]|nr:type II secretion system protein [Gemmatimonadaceae bacterium]